MTNNKLTDERIEKMAIETINTISTRLAETTSENGGSIEVNASLFLNVLRELQKRRKADAPELKIANLINKFYERYPLSGFRSDTERAEAMGYFLAGAELQCFGEFVQYEDLFCDE